MTKNSWGWMASIWLAYMLSQGDHRKQPVQAWVRQAHQTIANISGQEVSEYDFTDNKLSLLLRRHNGRDLWNIER